MKRVRIKNKIKESRLFLKNIPLRSVVEMNLGWNCIT